MTVLMLKAMFNNKRQPGAMYVCLCMGVTERDVIELAREGASAEEVSACSGAGTRCGTCVSTVRDLVHETQACPESRRRLEVIQRSTVTAA